MSDRRPYYEAYDDRYRQVHSRDLQWFMDGPSPIVGEVVRALSIPPSASILELGCGEGRDAAHLLTLGYDVLATDISPAAISYCRGKFPAHAHRFCTLDCVRGGLDGRFDFIYAVAVIHMLVEDSDRAEFYRFIRRHLTPGGHALICTMGDGRTQRRTDPASAFDLQQRVHESTGQTVCIASTSCRMVDFPTFERELSRAGLNILKQGITSIPPDFPQMMYAVVTGT